MPRTKKTIIEYRNYNLPAAFPVILLTGEKWRISDIPADRLHFHNCLEIGLCESDSGTMEFMDNASSFSAGDVTIVASDISHTTYSSPGTKSKWSYIFVDIDELFYPFFSMDFMANGDILHELIHNFSAILPKQSYPKVHTLVEILIDTLQNKGYNYQFSARGLMMSLMIELMNIYIAEDHHTTSNIQTHENSLVIAPALDYIRKNYMQEFTMESLSDICNMSSTHFRRVFTSVMGTGPLEYLNRTRIEKASSLLRTTDLPVLQISENVGFHSISSFNRHFSTIMGYTPREWRKKMSYIKNQSVLKYTGWMVPPQKL